MASTATLCVLTTVTGLLVSLACLDSIGEPPWLRIDSLWVHRHRSAIRLLCGAGLAATAATAACLVLRRHRVILAIAWTGSGVVAATYFGKTVTIIARVIAHHSI